MQTAQDVSFNNVLALLVDLSTRCIQPKAQEPSAEMDRKSVTLKGIYLLNKGVLWIGSAQEEFCVRRENIWFSKLEMLV